MDIKEVRKSLKSNPRLINIVGKEELFRKQAASSILSNYINLASQDFNVDTFLDIDKPNINSAIVEVPFDSEFRVVFLVEAEQFVKNRADSTVMVALDGSLKAPHLVIDCSRLYGRRLKAFVRSQAKQHGLTFDPSDVDLFVSLNGNNLSTLESELLKLKLVGEVNQGIIKEFAKLNISARLNSFFDCLFKKDLPGALKFYYILQSLGINDNQLFGFFVFSIKSLMQAFLFKDEESIDEFEVRKFFKFKPFVDEARLLTAFSYLSKIERPLKMGQFPFFIFLFAFFKKDYSIVTSYLSNIED